jgi:precorrin-6B methylase 1
MPNNNELRQVIKTTLNEFETTSLRDASIALLKTLDYQSDKTITVAKSDPKAFLELLAEHNPDVTVVV